MAQESESSPGLFNTIILIGLLLAGFFIGREVCSKIIPESNGAQMLAMAMLPLGAVIGLSFGQGALPPMSILNLISVFDGKASIEEIISRGGSAGGALSLSVATVLGTVVTCGLFAVVISMFMKPPIGMGELMMWFGAAGAAYAVVVSGAVWAGVSE